MELIYYRDLRRYEKSLKRYESIKNFCDYKYKADLLSNNLPLYLTQAHFNERQEILRELPIDTTFRDNLAEKFGFCAMLESYRLNDSYKHRILRLREKISNIIYNYDTLFFITFTFTDSTLSQETKAW